ncbi:MAG: hypothetical protein HGJ94_18305 [Desulfosarcina sp.]|nr:hypothetical protein [Desulfosarcina sp.]
MRDLVDPDFINSLAAYATPITRADGSGNVGQVTILPPSIFSVSGGTFRNTLSWSASLSSRAYYYEIRIAEVSAGSSAPAITSYSRTIIATHPVTSATDTGLNLEDKDYYYWIRAVDFSGENFSAWVSGNVLTEFLVGDTIEHVIAMLKGGSPDNYSAATTYYEDDQVYYVTTGRTYICIDDNSGAGITGVAPTTTANWRRHGILLTGDVDGVSMVAIDGGLVVDGSILARHVAANTITAAEIAANTITASQIASATITASELKGTAFGTLTISSGKIAINTTDGLDINSGGTMGVSGDIVIKDGGDVKMTSGTLNGSRIGWFYQNLSTQIAEMGCDAGSGTNFVLRTTTSGGALSIGGLAAANKWNTIGLYASSSILMRGPTHFYDDAEPYDDASYDLGSSTRRWLNVYCDSISANDILPETTATYDLGSTSLRWDYIYSSHSLNVADFFHMDDRLDGETVVPVDDVEVIRSIKPSLLFDPSTGLRLIDDATLPAWLVHKHQKPGEHKDEAGKIIQSWKKGDVAVDHDGKPYLSTTIMLSLLMGAARQVADRLDTIDAALIKHGISN